MINLSFSAATKYLLSPRSYFLHYLLRLRPIQTSSALLFGAAIDTGLNELLSSRNLQSAQQKFIEAWSRADINGVVQDLSSCDLIKYSKADHDDSFMEPEWHDDAVHPAWNALKYKGLMILEAYNAQVLPRMRRVLAVQKQIEMPNELGDKLVGVVDAIVEWEDGRILLVDNKTSSVKYKAESASESEQLSTYFHACEEEYGLSGVLYIVIPKSVRKRKEPRIEISFVPGIISDELVNRTFEKYDQVLHGIKMGDFHCSGECMKQPWGCTFSNYCLSNGHDLTGLVKVEKK